MEAKGCSIQVESVAKFFRTLRISGSFSSCDDELRSVELVDSQSVKSLSSVGEPICAAANRVDQSFDLQALRRTEDFNAGLHLRFRTRQRRTIVMNLDELARERLSMSPSPPLYHRFRDRVSANDYSVLDIGGRDRSGVLRRRDFDVSDYVVLDVVPGDNVDVVGDAHLLASLFPPERFDAFFSVSVFEHLLMPWAVVAQINRVLKTGGIGFITTHQTLGMHDLPWDYWRFSDTCWDGLFNEATGFEIVERTMGLEQFIIPFIYRPEKKDAEKAAGFELVSVWVRKVGPCQMSWEISPGQLISTMYPSGA